MAYSILACPIDGCGFSSKQEKRFLEHVSVNHGLDPETLYIERVLGGSQPACGCGCGAKTKWLGWQKGHAKLIRGHNARIYTAFSDPATIEKCIQSRIEGRHRPWNAGLVSTSDPRLAAAHEKAARTLRERYSSGEIIPWQSGLTFENDPRIRKMSETKRERHASGAIRPWNEGFSKDNNAIIAKTAQKISTAYDNRSMGKRLAPDEIKLRIGEAGFDLLDDSYRNRKGSRLHVKCRKCETTQDRTLYSIESTRKCFTCCPKETTGHAEIFNLVRSIAPDARSNDRHVISPFELDIVIPSQRLAIEFNGLYWHSEVHRGKDYHAGKTHAASNAGYRLIHIFEDEWRDRRSIIESMLKHRLGQPSQRIGARKCELVRVEPRERSEFFNRSHIDGDVKAIGAWGLRLNGEILACLSARRPVHSKWSRRLEVARFAVLPGHSVPGALSRLSAAVRAEARDQGLDGLMSYVDTRYGDGAGYLASGYQLHSRTGPTFWWTDLNSRFNRFRYRADSSRGMTEAAVAQEAGVIKVWGCDQLVMIL